MYKYACFIEVNRLSSKLTFLDEHKDSHSPSYAMPFYLLENFGWFCWIRRKPAPPSADIKSFVLSVTLL
jgi:hypothetical protein